MNRLIAISYDRQIWVHVRLLLPSLAYHSPQSVVEFKATVEPAGAETATSDIAVVFNAWPVYVPPDVDTHSVDPQ